ncbi:MAG: ABC transporter ATP-binding protein [Bacteroidota bacterium]
MQVLQTQGLSKLYGSIQAVDQLNLDISAGSIYGILGPNGSGKTTTLGMVLGITQPTAGSYHWFDGQAGAAARQRIGALLETPNFFPYLNADDNLAIVAHIKKSKNEDFTALLDLVGLTARRKSPFSTFSLGMKQRLAIASALIGDPDVLIFDEPTNGLDPQGIVEVRNTLLKIAQSGKTIIMASHILDEVEKICSHVAILKSGKLLASGTVGSILSNDQTIEVASDNLGDLAVKLQGLPAINSMTRQEHWLELSVNEDFSAAELNQWAFQNQITLHHLVARKRSLESEFLEITSK